MDIQPTDLRYFFEAATTLNFSRAAERLGIGQPTLSQAMRRLEDAIGAKIFDRFKTGVQLTAVGRRLLNEGRSTLDSWERLKSGALAADQAIQGRYSIGCHPTVGLYALPVFLKDLLAHNIGLEISLHHGLSREVLENVVSFRTDFGLVMNPVRHPDLVIHELCEDRMSFYKASGASEDTLLYEPALAQSQTLIRRLGTKTKFTKFMQSASLEVIAGLANQGCGVAILPERLAKLYPALSLLDRKLPSVRDQLCLIYRADRRATAASRVIVQAIKRAKF